MIKLTKSEEPDVLKHNGAAWLNVLETKLAAGEIPTDAEKSRYRHPEIKAALRLETHGKCAYCESYLLHIAFGDIEHVIPKSLQLKQTFRWENLTLACHVCNTYKSNAVNIVDPYVDDPSKAFFFAGPMIFPNAGNDKAVNTEKKLQLNRSELLERRVERLKNISNQILLIANTTNAELKETLKKDLEDNDTADSAEFAAFSKSLIDQFLPQVS